LSELGRPDEALAPAQEAVASGLVPKNPTLQNFAIVLGANHNLVQYFWHQLGASVFIAVMVSLITLAIGACANFAITRIRIRGGRMITNIALLTYLIPAAFLAIPMYKIMGTYRLVDTPWSLIFAMVALASPYAIWVMNQASQKIPRELDEAAKVDGAGTLQIFRLVYLPLMAPTMVAIGTYALLLAWNEYLYAFLMLATESRLTLAVALGNFLAFDDARLREVAAAAPYDFIEVVVNDRKYGGGGIHNLYATVAADNEFTPYVFVHEFGHPHAVHLKDLRVRIPSLKGPLY